MSTVRGHQFEVRQGHWLGRILDSVAVISARSEASQE